MTTVNYRNYLLNGLEWREDVNSLLDLSSKGKDGLAVLVKNLGVAFVWNDNKWNKLGTWGGHPLKNTNLDNEVINILYNIGD